MSSPAISAPTSFSGSARRILNATKRLPAWARPIGYGLAWVAILTVWMLVACWYLIFGILVVPYRLLRRGQRRRKAEDRRHRELVAKIEKTR